MSPLGAHSVNFYQYNKRLDYLNGCIPEAGRIGNFIPAPCPTGGRVTGHAPDDPKEVSNPKYILE
jgi:hypothetical protein